MESKVTNSRGTLQIFDSFEDCEAVERKEWLAMTGPEKMATLETLRNQTYPNEPGTPQGLQRVLTIAN